MEVPFDSGALRANVAGTAQEVVIPDRYLPLMRAVAGFHGVSADLSAVLAEYFHTFRNVDHLIDGFQMVLLRDWAYFERSDECYRCVELLAELAVGLVESPLSSHQTSLLARQLLSWSARVLDGPCPGPHEETMLVVAQGLSDALIRHPAALLDRDGLLRALAERAASRPGLQASFTRLYRDLLVLGYHRLCDRLPVPQWASSGQAGLAAPAAAAAHFSFLAPERMSDLMEAAERTPVDGLFSAELPLFSEILDQAIDRIFKIEDLEDRFTMCLYFLKDDTLGYRQSQVMVDLLGVVRQLVEPERRADPEPVLSRLTRFFRAHDEEFLMMQFQCYEVVGVAIGQSGNARAADHLIENLLWLRFQYPDIGGATDEWQTVANPFHLSQIRCWMHIIESNPSLYERLAAALNVQLRLGGVHVADTDLFQRDVTRFLNADIRSIYFVAKQLLRAFPVYFRDLGAEGELRAVSTEMDEICGRKDTLTHFLRKQSHAESSNRLVAFSRAALVYWATLDPSGLEPYLSQAALKAVRSETHWAEGPHRVLSVIGGDLGDAGGGPDGTGLGEFVDRLAGLPYGELEELLARVGSMSEADQAASRRVLLMLRTHQLLVQKYSLSIGDLASAVEAHLPLDGRVRQRFTRALTDWQRLPGASSRDRLLDASLTVLERLKEIVCDPAWSEATESIYHKRHIAAGIPSMYGNYSEPKFDALGLSFRLEGFVGRLLEDLVADGVEEYITHESLRRMAVVVRQFKRALVVDGLDSQALTANLGLLESGLESRNFTFHQYQNVFQFIVGAVTELSRTSVLSHDQVLRAILEHDTRQSEARRLAPDAVAEAVLREILVAALGMQALDRYVSAALRQISTLALELSDQALTCMMNYDPERLISPIHVARPEVDDQRTLGFKGLGLKQMASYGHRVPEGFVLTTELFAARPALEHRSLFRDTLERIRTALENLERATGLRLGDPERLLLLSIRSGAAISMPGSMATFVNVGLNDDLAEALAHTPGFEWAAWDSYRRFLQSWAMTSGADRDFFDGIMNEFKTRFGIERKLDFPAAHMRELALAYKSRARELGVTFEDDPFRQVIACVRKVAESWDSPEATLYREYLNIAPEWGTAVIVQRMVFGNRSRESGSGVTFTHDPTEPYSRRVRLFGDFTARSQGEDLVGGLVFPLPISETQRLSSPIYRNVEHSLEKDYPDVYRALLGVAHDLVHGREFDPQEIEFTFESSSGEDLYILQKRAMVQEQTKESPYFDTASLGFSRPVAMGTGVAGGAFSGRVAITTEQIDRLLGEVPAGPVILLRPDTVPEDIAMIARAAGLLTARGGATSHAAVTARRLGKTAVVDCRELEVIESEGVALLAGQRLEAGEWLSIDGRTGAIYGGHLPIRSWSLDASIAHPTVDPQASQKGDASKRFA